MGADAQAAAAHRLSVGHYKIRAGTLGAFVRLRRGGALAGAQPDTWQYFDAKGNLTRRESEEDGDGNIDRWHGGHGHPERAIHQGGRARPRARALKPRARPAYFQVSWFLRLSPLLAVTSTSATQLVASGNTPGSSSSTTRCAGPTSFTFGMTGLPVFWPLTVMV